jgi:basic membrane protein A
MHRNIFFAMLITLIIAAMITSCDSDSTKPVKIGLVADTGGIGDRSFNATAWKGVQDAERDMGILGAYLESQLPADYEQNTKKFLDQNYELIITVGFPQAVTTKTAAEANPDRKFAIVDYSYDPVLPNVLGMTFKSDEAAFLAGYLAAGMSTTGKVGTFGGIQIPPVTIFMVGLEKGVQYYNRLKGTNVEFIGWKTDPGASACGTGRFTETFVSLEKGRLFANQLMDEGADIIIPLAGTTGIGAAAAIKERAKMMIGVDSDQYIATPDYKEIYLTSILKNSDKASYDVIKSVVDKTFTGGTYVGTIKNNGVGIAPYHDFEARIPAALKGEIEQLKMKIIDGTVATGWGDCLE